VACSVSALVGIGGISAGGSYSKISACIVIVMAKITAISHHGDKCGGWRNGLYQLIGNGGINTGALK
jgi:hypothetical protein